MAGVQSVKGVQDVLPPKVAIWQRIEQAAREVFAAYGFAEARPPIMEYTQVFTRSIGETSDIVEKEMYTFKDKGDRSITLRPEGTAPLVRAYVQHSLHTLPAPQKYFYLGPMFRYERPQRGRLRQFTQVGAEAFGLAGPGVDADLIASLVEFLSRVGLKGLTLELNSIGCEACRPGFRTALVEFFTPKHDHLCPDCQRRLGQNPLRVMDCKVPGCIELKAGAPTVNEHLCGGCREHFDGLTAMLNALDVNYVINPLLVRGLDYYTRTTFEVKSESLGAQNAVAAGGRYDKLVKESGGPDVPAIGFAVGLERIVEVLSTEPLPTTAPDFFIVSMGAAATVVALKAAQGLRSQGVWVELGYGEGSLKSQMRRADKSGARLAIIIGDDELTKGQFTWKDLRNSESGQVAPDELITLRHARADNS